MATILWQDVETAALDRCRLEAGPDGLRLSGIVLTPAERAAIEVADFGLGRLEVVRRGLRRRHRGPRARPELRSAERERFERLADGGRVVREVIDHGVTGFIVNSEDEAMEAIRALHTIDRRQVRHVFEHRFTSHVMARSYLTLYRRLLEGHATACRA